MTTEIQDCGDALVSANELLETDYGFGEYEVNNFDNLDITLVNKNEKEISLYMSLVDPFKDGVYTLTFTDRGGNDTIVSGIVQGFTASFVTDLDDNLISFNIQNIGSSKCMDIMLEN